MTPDGPEFVWKLGCLEQILYAMPLYYTGRYVICEGIQLFSMDFVRFWRHFWQRETLGEFRIESWFVQIVTSGKMIKSNRGPDCNWNVGIVFLAWFTKITWPLAKNTSPRLNCFCPSAQQVVTSGMTHGSTVRSITLRRFCK
jgi:hypothetical protein